MDLLLKNLSAIILNLIMRVQLDTDPLECINLLCTCKKNLYLFDAQMKLRVDMAAYH